MFSTRYYDADDLYGYHPPRQYGNRYYQNEDSFDRYLRMKEQENLEAAYARRRRRELQERQLYERRRQLALAEREKELRRWKRQQQQLAYQQQRQREKEENENDDDNDNDDDVDDYGIDIVRGRDGNFYYVKRHSKPQHNVQPTITEEIPRQKFRSEQLVVGDDSDSDSEYQSAEESDANSQADERSLEARLFGQRRKPPSRRNSRKHRITVTVEDASDSECENEFDSPWRNRRPSPGQWIEPVEPYYG